MQKKKPMNCTNCFTAVTWTVKWYTYACDITEFFVFAFSVFFFSRWDLMLLLLLLFYVVVAVGVAPGLDIECLLSFWYISTIAPSHTWEGIDKIFRDWQSINELLSIKTIRPIRRYRRIWCVYLSHCMLHVMYVFVWSLTTMINTQRLSILSQSIRNAFIDHKANENQPLEKKSTVEKIRTRYTSKQRQ